MDQRLAIVTDLWEKAKGWSWPQMIVVAVIVALLVIVIVKVGKALAKIVFGLITAAVVVYVGQSLGWWSFLPFDCPPPADLWNAVTGRIKNLMWWL